MNRLSAFDLREKFLSSEMSVAEHAKRRVAEARALDKKVEAFLQLSEEKILNQARALDALPQKEKLQKKLFGIPVAIKDNLCVEGEEATCASKILKGFVAPYDATVIARLKKEGALLFGRTNMDEFAMGSSTENSAFRVTRNPWDLTRIPGGSSGGSAAAVAAGQAAAALGSDTGGSIRQPAALCGVVGMKPTYGRVSRYGLVAFASSLDQIGPITQDVRDCALLMQVLAGHDEKDSTCAADGVPDYLSKIKEGIGGLRVGIPQEYFIKGMDPEVEARVRDAIQVLEKLGAKSQSVSLPHTPYAIAAYYLVATAEASSNLSRYDGVQYGLRSGGIKNLLDLYFKTRHDGFGDEVKRRIMLGTYALSAGYYDAYYLKALKVRTLLKRDFDDAFKKVDVIVTPTSPTPAFKVGEKTADPLSMYLSDIFTISVNLAGIPALALPCGFTSAGLPVGMQLMAKPFDEGRLMQVGHQYELATPHHQRAPVMS